jgi:Ca-activated chloride channel family protein
MFKCLQKVPHLAVLLLFVMVAGDKLATAQRPNAHLTVGTIEVTPAATGGTIEPVVGIMSTGASVPDGPVGAAGRPISDPQVQRISTAVSITVDGDQRVARVEVEEHFRNNGGRLAEGDYLYPIPAGAVFTDFSLFMGEQELKGEMLSAPRARGIYEEIVRRKKDPALIELVGHGLVRARVFPIGAGETRRVILRYTQVLGRDGHLVRLRYPRVVGMFDSGEGPVVGPRIDVSRREAVIRPALVAPPFTVNISVTDAHLFATPYSPTHRIEVRDRDGDEIDVDYDGTGEAPRDFELFLPLRETTVGASIVSHAPVGEAGFYMLLLSPPVDEEESSIPRDLTLVLDVSGSMSGDKIVQARAALDQMLAGLDEDDRFRIITFSSVVRQFRSGWSQAVRGEVAEARDWLARVDADGSTNIQAALQEALRPETDSSRVSQVVFLTDGKPTVGETSVEHIVELTSSMLDDERLFGFGVGHDVNTYLLDSLAEGGRGTVSYVGPGENVEESVSSLTRKIRHPALTDLRIVEAPVMLEDGYPQQLPDLFYGEDLVLFGRYRGDGAGGLVIEGNRGGRTERLRFDVEFVDNEPGNTFIPKLWAARKAGVLTTQVRLHGANPELVEEIRQLGLRYGILTEYTSYLVEEPGMSLDDATMQQIMGRAREMEVSADSQVGAVAFDRARRDAAAKRVGSLEEAARQNAGVTRPAAQASLAAPGDTKVDGPLGGRNELVEGDEGSARHVVDRMFVMRAGVWTDLRFGDERVVKVAPFSVAYFTLIERLPQLKPFVALGSRVIIAGDGLAIELDDAGVSEWIGRQLDAVLQAFGS